MKDRLKYRPKGIPESHFRKLIAYWRNEDVKVRHLRSNAIIIYFMHIFCFDK